MCSMMTSSGHLPAHLQRAIAAGNLLAARALAAELPRPLGLDEALAVLLLIAEREPQTYPRAAARFVGRVALERPLTIIDVEAAASTLLHVPTAPASDANLSRICERFGIRMPPPTARRSGRS
jgi:hypothetical protein